MNTTTPTIPPTGPETGDKRSVLVVVALNLPLEIEARPAKVADALGGMLFTRCLHNALLMAGLTVENNPLNVTLSLTKGFAYFFVGEMAPALSVLRAEMEHLGYLQNCAIGYFDGRECFFRACHPARPLFDLDARAREVGLHPEGPHFAPGEMCQETAQRYHAALRFLKTKRTPPPTPPEPPSAAA